MVSWFFSFQNLKNILFYFILLGFEHVAKNWRMHNKCFFCVIFALWQQKKSHMWMLERVFGNCFCKIFHILRENYQKLPPLLRPWRSPIQSGILKKITTQLRWLPFNDDEMLGILTNGIIWGIWKKTLML